MIFDRHRPDITEKAQRRKIEELETKLKKKDEVIAEIAEENMMIKKILGGRHLLHKHNDCVAHGILLLVNCRLKKSNFFIFN